MNSRRNDKRAGERLLVEAVKAHQAEVVEALETLKDSGDDHAEFYAELQKRQKEIVSDLEAMRTDEK